jgi:predicted dithiol-disulfide oxidoreductase (DUF899 family)
MNPITAAPCTLKDLFYVRQQIEFYAVNQQGKATKRLETSGGLCCYRCRSCAIKFDSWQAASGHVEATGVTEETVR